MIHKQTQNITIRLVLIVCGVMENGNCGLWELYSFSMVPSPKAKSNSNVLCLFMYHVQSKIKVRAGMCMKAKACTYLLSISVQSGDCRLQF